ncbi:uncharacterized protein PODANS_5_9130 [Podospora anserina S mat+]|uniref:Podospora anserina S mat+ genomic DNA chromosome 5, supercontig 9 n=1 Tax=Podospora anserina (strain S / ATCC MYA-4624 / DSM 980 / FGSC 10383) TaxID=515849 RepID=B2AKW5_PODAN|nr:uncharacterized protein PODANS_5_9130 [Podospora anserina S mat+]CAP64638.1 unnamed protein product [Podospora anserina S mat+]CDP30036.1 Putative protein of unknown function [Podospora anserina S mat+]
MPLCSPSYLPNILEQQDTRSPTLTSNSYAATPTNQRANNNNNHSSTRKDLTPPLAAMTASADYFRVL